MGILRIVCWLICPVVILVYGWQLILILLSFPDSLGLQQAGWGFASGCLFWSMFGKHVTVWQNLEHELTHSAVALLFLRRVRSLQSTETSGLVTFDGPGNNFVIVLAPYCLPTLSLTWLGVLILMHPDFSEWHLVLLGFLVGYDLASNLDEFHLEQPDIQQCGATFSAIFALASTVVIVGLICGVVASGYSGPCRFVLGGYEKMLLVTDMGRHVFQQLAAKCGL